MPLSAFLCLTLATAADAQLRGYYSSDPNVTIDLSVLDGSGNDPVVTRPLAPPPAAGAARDVVPAPSDLLFPPPAPPRSRLTGRYSALAPPPRESAPPVEPQARPAAPLASTAVPQTRPAPPQSRLTVPPPDRAPSAGPSPADTGREPAATPAAPKPEPPPPAAPKPAATPASPVEPKAAPPQQSTAAAPRDAVPPAETAARTSAPAAAVATATDTQVRVLFEAGSAKLPDAARETLLTLVGRLDENEDLRLQIEAYAQGTSETASQARRLSLSRALSVRSYLIEQGVRSTRMDVRALGNKPSAPPASPDRVDARLVER